MGCCAATSAQIKYENDPPSSKELSAGSNKSSSGKSSGKHKRTSITETKINQALIKKKMEHSMDNKPISFEKILLKFDKLRVVLGYVKDQFNQVADSNGKLSHDGLEAAMRRLNVNMSLNDILDLFDFVNVTESKEVSIKEFLVALTIGMVLDVIPALADTPLAPPNNASPSKTATTARPAPAPLKRSFSGFLGHHREIKEMLNLIVSAYLIFDPDGKGYILRSGVEKMLEEDGHKAGSNAMLSQQRWNEMDWDANGTIDFAEFVFSFTSWVDIEEEEE